MNATLTATDYMEGPLLLLGWIINSQLWDLLMSTGLGAIPFIVLMIREWYSVRREGDDEGNKGKLASNRIETGMWAMILCYACTCLPLFTVSIQANTSIVRSDGNGNACNVAVIGRGQWSSHTMNTMDGRSAKIPLWWAVVHLLSKGMTNGAIATIPCTPDWQAITTEVDLQSVRNPALRRELGEFQRACYGHARYKLFNSDNRVSDNDLMDTEWIGSKYFLETPGYYDSFYATRPILGFPYDEIRDRARSNTGPGRPGYPTCSEWWADSGAGLRTRLHESIDPTFWDHVRNIANLSTSVEDSVIRRMLSNQHGVGQNKPRVVRGYRDLDGGYFDTIGDGMSFIAGGAGGVMAGMLGKAGMDMLKQALPMIQYLLVTVVVIALPIVLLISGYSMTTAGTATFGLFGLWFLSFWWELARWLSSYLVTILHSGGGNKAGMLETIMSGPINAYDEMVLILVEWAMFLIFPALWMAMMSWAGYDSGRAIGRMLSDGSKSTKEAGDQASNIVKNTAMKGLGKK